MGKRLEYEEVNSMKRKVFDFVKNMDNKTIIYKCIRWLPFAVFLVVLFWVFSYIKQNALVVLEGEPKDIIIDNFEGDVAMDTKMICIDKGRVVNRDSIIFSINGNKYTALPGELVIEFDCDKDIEKYGNPYSNYLFSQNRDMYYSTTIASEYIMSADSITFERSNNTSEYFHGKINKASGYSGESKSVHINFGYPITKGLLEIQNNEILGIYGGITVYYKDEILENGYVQLEIMNEQHGCSFEFYNLSNLDVLLNESFGIALNGNINGISGEFEVGEGRMISTSPSSQRELYVGAQEIVLEGENLNVEYTFDSDSSEMVVKGNPNKARLENIDIMEGWVQFFLTNWAAIIMAFIGTIMSVSVGNIGKKE